MKFATLLLIPALILFAIACNGDDDAPSPTSTAASGSPTSTTGAGSPTVEATDVVPPEATPDSPGSTDAFDFPADPNPAPGIATLTDVRVGAHPEGDFDRIVFEFEGDRPAGRIEYVDEAAQCGSGNAVTDLGGGAILKVHFDGAQAHNDQGQQTIDGNQISGPGDAIAESRGICDFEGVVEWVAGVNDGEQPFTVYLLDSPNRVVIDIDWP